MAAAGLFLPRLGDSRFFVRPYDDTRNIIIITRPCRTYNIMAFICLPTI